MTETPKCPYCGGEMALRVYEELKNKWSAWYICKGCYSMGPLASECEEKSYAEEVTLVSTLHRAEPEMRPMTLEEISEKVYNTDWDFVWFEAKGDIFLLQLCPRYVNEEVLYFCWPLSYDEIEANVEEMGKSWRCWPRKPTPEQMAAEKWEE